MFSLSLGGRKSVTFATFVVTATLGLSMFPSNTKSMVIDTSEGMDDFFDCSNCNEIDEQYDCGEIIMLEDFASPKHEWAEMNDPVMGGKSTGTFSVDDSSHVGVFQGSVEIVSFLNAPGFIKAETSKGESWPDASSCEGIQLSLKSSTPAYKGFRVSFGNKRPKGAFPYTYGFKTDLVLDSTTKDFQTVKLPFDHFTDKWDAGSGDAVVTCAENNEFCPQQEDKKSLYSIAVWGEGVEGKVDLEIQSIAAYGCKGTAEINGNSSDSVGEVTVDSKSVENVGGDDIVIEDFANPAREWSALNDPVMGGKSTSSVSLGDGMAKFEGTCAIVPFLRAPGFITMVTGDRRGSSDSAPFPDVSGCQGMALTLRSSVDYKGYYVSFGTDIAPGGRYAMGYKTPLDLDASEDFVDIQLPFSDFSSKWDDATGKTKVTCQEDHRFCPSLDNLQDMKTISFWGEGVEGNVALDVKYIGAYGCASGATFALASAPTDQANSGSVYSSSSALLVMALLVAGVVYVPRFFRRSQHSAKYEELDVSDNAGLV